MPVLFIPSNFLHVEPYVELFPPIHCTLLLEPFVAAYFFIFPPEKRDFLRHVFTGVCAITKTYVTIIL